MASAAEAGPSSSSLLPPSRPSAPALPSASAPRLLSGAEIAHNFERFVTADVRAIGRALNSTRALIGSVGEGGADAAQRLGGRAMRGVARLASTALASTLGIKLDWLPPAACDLRCDEHAALGDAAGSAAAHAACVARQHACVAQISLLAGSHDAMSTPLAGLSVEYDPAVLKALGAIVMVVFIFYLYAWQSSLYYGGPNIGAYVDPLDKVAKGFYIYKRPKQPYEPMKLVPNMDLYESENLRMGGASDFVWGKGHYPKDGSTA